MHRMRITRHGDVGPAGEIEGPTDLERFMVKVERDSDSGCLLWMEGTDADGYGQFCVGGVTLRAHRWIFGEKFGYLPSVVRHHCDTPACVNWERCLIGGTEADNMRDKLSRGRQAKGEAVNTCKLTAVEVMDIRRECVVGILTQTMLAEVYGVTQAQISAIARRITWKHL